MQLNPVAVLEALEAMGFAADALETVGQAIITAEAVSVEDLVSAGLSGRDIIAVRRALDPSVSGLAEIVNVIGLNMETDWQID